MVCRRPEKPFNAVGGHLLTPSFLINDQYMTSVAQKLPSWTGSKGRSGYRRAIFLLVFVHVAVLVPAVVENTESAAGPGRISHSAASSAA